MNASFNCEHKIQNSNKKKAVNINFRVHIFLVQFRTLHSCIMELNFFNILSTLFILWRIIQLFSEAHVNSLLLKSSTIDSDLWTLHFRKSYLIHHKSKNYNLFFFHFFNLPPKMKINDWLVSSTHLFFS